MRVILSLLFVVACAFAQDANETAKSDESQNVNLDVASANQPQDSNANAEATISPDDKLKDDIVTFDRPQHVKDGTRIDDPFIYVYPQTEEDLAEILETEQAVLTLSGVFEDKETIKAKINDTWVEAGDNISGWKVSNIELDQVELTFRTKKKVLYVSKNNFNIE